MIVEQATLEHAKMYLALKYPTSADAVEFASALLSLAAESEELRAELEKMRRANDNLQKDYSAGMRRGREETEATLESRYTALEKAARAVVDLKNTLEMDALTESQYGDEAAVPRWRDEAIDALGAILDSLTPKEGE